MDDDSFEVRCKFCGMSKSNQGQLCFHILKVSNVPKDVLFSYSHVDCRYKSDKCIMVLKLIVSPVFSDLGITAPPPASLNVY